MTRAVLALSLFATAVTASGRASLVMEDEPYADVAAAALAPEARSADEVPAELDALAAGVEPVVDDDPGTDGAGGLDVQPPPVAPARWTPADVHAALATASSRARCVVRHEVGGVGYDPYRNGRAGERGPVQLHPQGKLPTFYAYGYTDPHNPYQAVPFLDAELRRGEGYHWSPIRRGLC